MKSQNYNRPRASRRAVLGLSFALLFGCVDNTPDPNDLSTRADTAAELTTQLAIKQCGMSNSLTATDAKQCHFNPEEASLELSLPSADRSSAKLVVSVDHDGNGLLPPKQKNTTLIIGSVELNSDIPASSQLTMEVSSDGDSSASLSSSCLRSLGGKLIFESEQLKPQSHHNSDGRLWRREHTATDIDGSGKRYYEPVSLAQAQGMASPILGNLLGAANKEMLTAELGGSKNSAIAC